MELGFVAAMKDPMETGFMKATEAPMKTEALAEAGGSRGGRLSLDGLSLPTSGSAAINALGSFASQALDAVGRAGHAITALAAAASFVRFDEVCLVTDIFSNIFQDASDLAAAAEKLELSSFDEGESTDIINMRAGLNNLQDLLKRDLSDIKRFSANPPSGLVEFRRIAAQFDKGGTVHGLIGVSLELIVHYGAGNKNGDNREQQSAATATPTSWLLGTVRGTSRVAFEDFVSKLPDQGNGKRIIFPALNYQNYVTKMTLEAKAVSKNPIVDQLGSNEPMRVIFGDC